jgi:purine-binding chemotaxis protein CheW
MAVGDDFRFGVMIDAIKDVVDIPLSAITPPLSTLQGALRDLVTGTIEQEGQAVSLIDLGKVTAMITL